MYIFNITKSSLTNCSPMSQKSIHTIDLKKSLPTSFFYRPADIIAPDLLGCILVKRERNGEFLFGTIVETEAYEQSEQGCHGYSRRTPSNETLFGEPAHLYVYLTYGIYHCVNIVTNKAGWASGVLLRAISIPGILCSSPLKPTTLALYFFFNS